MNDKIKANPGSGRIWNLIMGVLRGPWARGPQPSCPRSFCSEYLWRQQRTATAAEQHPDTATSALSSCSSVVYKLLRLLTIIGTLHV